MHDEAIRIRHSVLDCVVNAEKANDAYRVRNSGHGRTNSIGYTEPLTFHQMVEAFGRPDGLAKEAGGDEEQDENRDQLKVVVGWDVQVGDIHLDIYDFKATKLYSDHPDYPTVEEFLETPYRWHVQIKGLLR